MQMRQRICNFINYIYVFLKKNDLFIYSVVIKLKLMFFFYFKTL